MRMGDIVKIKHHREDRQNLHQVSEIKKSKQDTFNGQVAYFQQAEEVVIFELSSQFLTYFAFGSKAILLFDKFESHAIEFNL